MQASINAEEASSAPQRVWSTVNSREAEALQEEIRSIYRECNPEKVEKGEVDSLLQKYKGQESLLLRRVQYHYGLVVMTGRLWRRDENVWRRVKASLRADGLLRWTSDKGGEDMDVRKCAVDEWDAGTAGRKLAFAVFATSDQGTKLLVAAAESPEAKRQWIRCFVDTNDFFAKLRHERQCQREEEIAELEARRESERTLKLEEARRQAAQAQADLDTLRATARSKLETTRSSVEDADGGVVTGEEAVMKLKAELEAALDDALFATNKAADAEANGKFRDAHAAYRDAVAAYLEAKLRVEAMQTHDRPERQVLVLIDDGSEQCKRSADALRARHAQQLLQAEREEKEAQQDVPHDFTATPLLDVPRPVPAAIEKLILDADDL